MQSRSNGKQKVVVILPAYNEEGKIGIVVTKTLERAKGIVDQVVVVDDGSSDKTAEESRASGAFVISHPKNKGVGAGIRTGLDYAVKQNFDIAIVMGCDDQDDPAEIPSVLAPIIEQGYDFVQGSRYRPGGAQVNIPLFRFVTTHAYALMFRIITCFPCTDGTNGFRAFRLSMLQDKRINLWQDWLDTYELEPYLFYKAVTLKYRVTEAPVTKYYPHQDSKVGYTKMIPLLDWWRIARPLVYLRLGLKK
jgi:dolichol-phosphate mannosyltransferase